MYWYGGKVKEWEDIAAASAIEKAFNVDYATDLKLRRAIKDLPFNPTTVIISQRTSSIMNCDIILVLEDGKIVGQGTHNELLEACEIYNEIHSFEVNNS